MESQTCTAKITSDGSLEITTDEPMRGVSPGQVAALWDGHWCLGCGVISGMENSATLPRYQVKVADKRGVLKPGQSKSNPARRSTHATDTSNFPISVLEKKTISAQSRYSSAGEGNDDRLDPHHLKIPIRTML
jgi:hypothetical protein